MPLVEVEQLVQRFGDVVAVDGLSFAIEPGEVFALLGPNGAGKTTTIRVLVTLLRPSAGRVRIAGLDVVEHPTRVRRVLGYVPQTLSADGSLTGYENLLIVAKLLRLPGLSESESLPMCLHLCVWKMLRTASCGRIPAEWCVAWRSHRRSCTGRSSSSSMNPRSVWIRLRDGRCGKR